MSTSIFLSASTRSTSPASPCNRTELRMLYRQHHRQNHPSDALKLEIPSLFASYSARVLMIPLDKGKHRQSFLNDGSMHTHKYTASSTSLYLSFITQSLLPVGVASLTALEIDFKNLVHLSLRNQKLLRYFLCRLVLEFFSDFLFFLEGEILSGTLKISSHFACN